MSFVIMGCSPSALDTDPNVMYAHKRPTENKLNQGKNVNDNNSVQNGTIPNGHVVDKNTKDEINKTIRGGDKTTKSDKTIRGDLSQWSEAKHGREKRVKDRQAKRDQMAQVMSELVMEEKERLSLVSSRSRMTSRATSRTASPRHSRVNEVYGDQEKQSNSATGSRQTSAELSNIKERTVESSSENGERNKQSNAPTKLTNGAIHKSSQNGTIQNGLPPTNQNSCNNNTVTSSPSGGGVKCVTFHEEESRLTGSVAS